MITRRGLLTSVPAWSFLTTLPGILTFPTRANAEIVTAIALTVAFASSMVSLFNRSSGLASQLAILNAKLDTIIELQRLTLESIQIVSQQIEELSRELDQALINQEFRETLAETIGLIANISVVTQILNDDIDSYSVEELRRVQGTDLDEFCQRAIIVTSQLAANLQASTVDTDRGLTTVRLASVTAFMAQGLVPALQGIDAACKDRTGINNSKRIVYRQILDSLDSVYRQLSEKHGPEQIRYELSQIDANPFIGHEPQWLTRIPFPSDQAAWTISIVFQNHHAHGPCNNGVNFDDEARARSAIALGSSPLADLLGERDSFTWTNYRYTVAADLMGQTAIVDGTTVGPYGVSIKVTAQDRLHTQTWRATEADWGPRKDEDTGYPLLPLRFPGQFYCPGYPMRDRHWGSLALLERFFRPDLEQNFPSFSARLDNVTLRGVNKIALESVVAWATNAITLAEVSRNAIPSG